jgi:hypothetical protein
LAELEVREQAPDEPVTQRLRGEGGGRKRLIETNPQLLERKRSAKSSIAEHHELRTLLPLR